MSTPSNARANTASSGSPKMKPCLEANQSTTG